MGNVFGKNVVNLATSALTLVHIGACKVKSIVAMSQGTSGLLFLQIWDLGRTPILGIDVATYTFEIPSMATQGEGTPAAYPFPAGLCLENGLAYMIGATPAATTASSANVATGTIDWKAVG